jgi:hypothetical protein
MFPGLGLLPSVGFTPDLFIGVKPPVTSHMFWGPHDIETVTAGRTNANKYATGI